MSVIQYFPYDHLDVTVGIYKNRVLQTGNDEITLYELRMSHPYKQKVIDADALHSIEHLCLQYIYDRKMQNENVLFFGTMSCRTGCILIVQNMSTSDVVKLIEEMFQYAADFEGELPLLRMSDCGNIYGHDPLQAREEAARYLAVLKSNPQGNCSYYNS
ncbi:MAG: S-ribosylhomocysteine lyase [Synergistaceae bacterium]|nr:S-ribosylhomocysteine lyase [Synergistaceae bacterium]